MFLFARRVSEEYLPAKASFLSFICLGFWQNLRAMPFCKDVQESPLTALKQKAAVLQPLLALHHRL
jgi:hypothetical protein